MSMFTQDQRLTVKQNRKVKKNKTNEKLHQIYSFEKHEEKVFGTKLTLTM